MFMCAILSIKLRLPTKDYWTYWTFGNLCWFILRFIFLNYFHKACFVFLENIQYFTSRFSIENFRKIPSTIQRIPSKISPEMLLNDFSLTQIQFFKVDINCSQFFSRNSCFFFHRPLASHFYATVAIRSPWRSFDNNFQENYCSCAS